MLLHPIICVIEYKMYIKRQGYLKASLFIFLLWLWFTSALCLTPFLIFSSLCFNVAIFFNEVVCSVCFGYFLDSLLRFLINSSLISSHTSVLCAVWQL